MDLAIDVEPRRSEGARRKVSHGPSRAGPRRACYLAAIEVEGARALSTVVQDTDAALAFGTIALIVLSLVAVVFVFVLLRRIWDAVVKWYYRRKYAAEFRRRNRD